MKFMHWIIPQVFQFKAGSKPFPWAIFAIERQEERCPLCHSLIFWPTVPAQRGLLTACACLSHLLGMQCSGLKGLGDGGPKHPWPGEQ